MRLASVFFLSVLFVAVHSAPVESASEDPLRHDPAAHAPGHTGPMPAHDMPAASMENDSEPEMTHDMTEDKEKPDGKPGKYTEEKPDKETGKPAMSEDGMQHEDGHEGHESASHGSGESHEGHDHGSHGSQGSQESDESHEGHDHGSHGSNGPQGDSESAADSSDAPTTIVAESEDTPEPSSEAEEGVCISASHLEGFGSHELVFEKHVLARVLCDAAGSCATAGHIVNYKGNSMMMGRYCDFVGCEHKVMEVNSPRYQRGLKIPSVSDDMHFTAFAARFETRGEEAVLAAAVRAGL